MVVVMRAGLSVPYGARAATAAIATFYETLVMMAAGGLVAALGFALAAGRRPPSTVDAAGLGTARAGRSITWPASWAWGWGWRSWSWSLPPRLSPALAPGQPAVSRRGPGGLAPVLGRTAGPRATLVGGGLDLPRPQPDRGGPGAACRGPVRVSRAAARGDRPAWRWRRWRGSWSPSCPAAWGCGRAC